MKLLRRLIRVWDGVLNLSALLATLVLASTMLFIVLGVVMRYFWGRPIIGMVEVTGYCLAFITFLGTAWLLREEGHVKMDLVLTHLSPKIQASFGAITSVIGAIICLVIAWYGVKVTWDSFQTSYTAISELRVPMFLLVFIVPVGYCLLFIQFLRRSRGFLREWRVPRD